nr:FAD-binding oxidoreductase [Actibacterium sp. 188UL27-1]
MARPERARALSALAAEGPALGKRRSYGDACLVDGGKAVDMGRLDRYLDFDAEQGLLTVEAGCALGQIARDFAPRGWLPAVMPGTGFATVGGGIAMNVHGKNHHGAGAFSDHIIEFELETPKGRKTVRPGDPLFLATVGGLGQTGIITQATLKLTACKGDLMMVTERRVPDLETFCDLLDESEATYTVGWIDATARGEGLGRGILEEGETGSGLVPAAKRGKKIPMDAPGWALSAPVVKTFNAAYYRRVPLKGRTVVKPIDDFFFPLDKIHDWNRLYGKNGFHQFQCVLPVEQRPVLREMMAKISKAGLASPLAVLKRMGPGSAGHLSFPMEGYTLAVDFPNRKGAASLVHELNAMTLDAGGRIYLAKDSVATAAQVKAMYPDWQTWAKACDAVDPEKALVTDLVKRLELRTTT